ncbi:MAG: acyl-CoA dehydrogenase, partial [Actinomycetia bacterium]|nr:acyl-CoA dehydrogenase [Actinomycetes bacterium]
QLAIFEDREEHTVGTLAQRMRSRSANGSGDDADPAEVLSAVQPHMIAAAWAHIDRLLLEAFAEVAEGCEDEETRTLLCTVCDLFVYSTVEANAAWFLEHGRISAAQSKAVSARVDELCTELAPRAEELVEAFAVADAWIECRLLERA